MGESALHALREEEEVRLFGALGGELRVRREGVDEVPPGRESTPLSVLLLGGEKRTLSPEQYILNNIDLR